MWHGQRPKPQPHQRLSRPQTLALQGFAGIAPSPELWMCHRQARWMCHAQDPECATAKRQGRTFRPPSPRSLRSWRHCQVRLSKRRGPCHGIVYLKPA